MTTRISTKIVLVIHSGRMRLTKVITDKIYVDLSRYMFNLSRSVQYFMTYVDGCGWCFNHHIFSNANFIVVLNEQFPCYMCVTYKTKHTQKNSCTIDWLIFATLSSSYFVV